MKIYNEDKTKELLLSDCDLEMGYLTDYTEEVYHEAVEHVEEQGHYEVIREYPSGGKDVEWIVDVPKVEGRRGLYWDNSLSNIYLSRTYTITKRISKTSRTVKNKD